MLGISRIARPTVILSFGCDAAARIISLRSLHFIAQGIAQRKLRSSARPLSLPLGATTGPRTMYDKIWDSHVVDDSSEGGLIYVDRHLVHEVS
jgi:hypothetical protein